MKVKTSQIKNNPKNPRILRDDKFLKLKKSIQEFPEMLEKRPIVCFTDKDGKYVALGGNMRLKAVKEIGIEEVEITLADDWTEEQKNQFMIKDNVGYGEWDWDILANEWDSELLSDWGLDVPSEWGVNPDELDTDFNLPDGDKAPFQQMTFTMADEQANQLKHRLEEIKQTDEYKYCETFGNENSNGNALYTLITRFYGKS
jgi:hypothetical protein